MITLMLHYIDYKNKTFTWNNKKRTLRTDFAYHNYETIL